MPDAIRYLDSLGKLRLGGGLTTVQIDALIAGQQRAMTQLELAATLALDGSTLKVINHTGHKLISGYPEGRRICVGRRGCCDRVRDTMIWHRCTNGQL